MDQIACKSSARISFSQQLRKFRIARGFKTARGFANALGIDENRYTRYERAEVEPALDLLHAICRRLGVTPNELLAGDPRGDQSLPVNSAGGATINHGAAHRTDKSVMVAALAWRLAAAVVAGDVLKDILRCASMQAANGSEVTSVTEASSPSLSHLRQTTSLYRLLMAKPITTLSAIAAEGVLADIDPQLAQQILNLSNRLAQELTEPSSTHLTKRPS